MTHDETTSLMFVNFKSIKVNQRVHLIVNVCMFSSFTRLGKSTSNQPPSRWQDVATSKTLSRISTTWTTMAMAEAYLRMRNSTEQRLSLKLYQLSPWCHSFSMPVCLLYVEHVSHTPIPLRFSADSTQIEPRYPKIQFAVSTQQ